MQKPDSIIFDMDGTLWDAVDSYVWIWNEGFRQLNLDIHLTREDLLHLMGLQTDIIIEKNLANYPNVDRQMVYDKIFSLQEKTMHLLGGKLYDGVARGIEKLSKKYKLFVLSNCEKKGIEQFLEYTHLKNYFTDSLTFGETRLPKFMNMNLLKERHQLKNPVYVGDTDSDQKQTAMANIPFVFASYGFGTTEHYDLKFDNFNDLTNYFMNL